MSGEEFKKPIGQQLQELRRNKGLTQSEMGEVASLSPEHYGRLERGENLPSIPTLVRLARFHQVSVDIILGLKESVRENPPDPKIQRLIDALKALDNQDRDRFLKGFLALIPRVYQDPR